MEGQDLDCRDKERGIPPSALSEKLNPKPGPSAVCTLGKSSARLCSDLASAREPCARSVGDNAPPPPPSDAVEAAKSTSTNGGRRAATSVPRWLSAATTTATTAAGIEAPALRMSSRLATASGTWPPPTQYSSTRLTAAHKRQGECVSKGFTECMRLTGS